MKFYRSTVLLFGLLLLTQFNGCGGNNTSGFASNSLLAACDPPTPAQSNSPSYVPGTNCAMPDSNYLMVNPEGGDQGILAGEADFDISGTCNGSGFPRNVISWQLKLNNVMVRHSGMIYNGQAWNSQCVNGTFIAYVHLGPISEDNYNRTGLLDPQTGAPAPYTLDITITGYDVNGTPYVNATTGIRTINLNPM